MLVSARFDGVGIELCVYALGGLCLGSRVQSFQRTGFFRQHQRLSWIARRHHGEKSEAGGMGGESVRPTKATEPIAENRKQRQEVMIFFSRLTVWYPKAEIMDQGALLDGFL